MTYREKLRRWYSDEKKAGRLVDIRFFPGTDRNVSIEEAAREVFKVVATNEREKFDITDRPL